MSVSSARAFEQNRDTLGITFDTAVASASPQALKADSDLIGRAGYVTESLHTTSGAKSDMGCFVGAAGGGIFDLISAAVRTVTPEPDNDAELEAKVVAPVVAPTISQYTASPGFGSGPG